MKPRGDGPDAASRIATGTLIAALASVIPSWWLCLEQVVPGLILLVGCWRLQRHGLLRWTPEAIAFGLLILWSLTSMTAVDGWGNRLMYMRGEVHLIVGLATWLVAVRVDPSSIEWRRFLKLVVVFMGAILAVSMMIIKGIIPLQPPSLLTLVVPDLETPSAFVNEFVLNRQLGTKSGVSLLYGVRRQSSFFLYQGGLMTAFLLFIGWQLMARRHLARGWALAATGGVSAALGLSVLTGSRSGLVLGWGLVIGLAIWTAIAQKPWRRDAIRVVAGLVLLTGVIAVIPVGDGTSLEDGALWERVLTDFRVRSFLDRLEVYDESIERLAERPLTGWGVQGSPDDVGRYLRLGTHSEPLNIAYRFGWVGLGLALAGWLAYVLRLASGWRPSADLPILLLALGALAATGMVRTFQWDLNVFWLVVAFLGTSRTIIAPPRSLRPPGRDGSFSMLGAEVNAMTVGDLHAAMAQALDRDGRLVIGHQNMHGLYLLPREAAVRDFAAVADRVFLDGMALVWMARALGHDVGREHRVTYADWLAPLAAECERRGWRVFHLGGRPGVGETAARLLRERHPGLEIGTRPGYFEDREVPRILSEITDFRPHVLMVGMGMPRQEAFVASNLDKIDAGVILTCGACMDYVAGVIATPPRWAGRVGLEWLFRLFAEPRRLSRRYLVEPLPVLKRFVAEWWARSRDGSP